MKEISIILAILFCSLNLKAHATTEPITNPNKIYMDSKEQAKLQANKIFESQNNVLNFGDHNIITGSEGETVELGDLPLKGEQAREQKQNECTKDSCNVASSFSAYSVNKREAKLESLGFSKNKNKEDGKGYLDKANRLIKEASKKFDHQSGGYKECTPIEKIFAYKEQHECDLYYDVKYDNCPIIQAVEIDSKYTYLCNKKRSESIKTCHDEIVSISCKNSNDCDNGGLIALSVQSDITWEYNYPSLTIGRTDDSYWRGNCETYDKVTEFEIRNKDKITEFLLTEVGFDDYLWIKLNDHTIYVGPYGGNKIEVKNWAVENGNRRDDCEQSTHRHYTGINKDLRPYLKEGINSLFMRVVVSGTGEGWIRIRARQHCCKDWDIKREQKCDYEGEE